MPILWSGDTLDLTRPLHYLDCTMPTRESKATIKIPRALYRRLTDIIDGSGFDSVTDFVVYVLRDIASGIDRADRKADASDDTVQLTAQEVEKVRRRLKNLGYL
ncbi:CopG family transcriptional regulator [bacterium]|nr:CopG family transcriptional regulator [candidate division CSSED10-310 bacterium]